MGFEIFVEEEELRSREVEDKRFPTLKGLLTNLLKEKLFAPRGLELMNYWITKKYQLKMLMTKAVVFDWFLTIEKYTF